MGGLRGFPARSARRLGRLERGFFALVKICTFCDGETLGFGLEGRQ